ncbi:MAG: NADPH-dependent F420 reductase [Candidatus Xenobia bacterium]
MATVQGSSGKRIGNRKRVRSCAHYRAWQPHAASYRKSRQTGTILGLMKIAFIGVGNVGAPLADHLQKLGHDVVIAARDPGSASVRKAQERNAAIQTAPPGDAVKDADVVFLATPFSSNTDAIKSVAPQLAGKVLVDCTNPVGPGISHGLDNKMSGSEQVQSLAPQARVVKAFTIYGYENFIDNKYPSTPVMLITGNDTAAKATVSDLVRQLGWEPLDAGPLANSLHLEHMTLLWVKMARVQGMGPNFTWGLLRR